MTAYHRIKFSKLWSSGDSDRSNFAVRLCIHATESIDGTGCPIQFVVLSKSMTALIWDKHLI